MGTTARPRKTMMMLVGGGVDDGEQGQSGAIVKKMTAQRGRAMDRR
jgi:hypothetical protein